MPRTRLAWHLFAGWCSLVGLAMLGCYWLASLQMARLTDDAQRRRLTEAAAAVAGWLSPDGGPLDPAAFADRARAGRLAPSITFDLLSTAGSVLASTADPPAESLPAVRDRAATDDALLAEARAGRTSATGRIDVTSGRRFFTMAVPHGPPGSPTAIIRATADTTDADAELSRAQRRLALGCLACGGIAVAAGWAVARRGVKPVEELGRAATRLAAGDVSAPLPASDLEELAVLGAAVARLREQLVERGILLGRQGTQQEAVLGSMIEGVLAIDARQRIVGINRAAADLLGIDLDQAARRTLQEVVRNPDLRRFALTAIDCREPVQDDIVLRGPRDRTIRVRGTALRDASGEGGAVIVLDDVTDMQRLERVRRDFVANVSHELKTPVASIKGFVETLLDGAADDPDDNRRFLGIIARQADRLAAIIEDLLALSRIEQSEGVGNLPLEEAALADVLTTVAAECGPRARERSIALEISSAAGLVAEINRPLVEQALFNLVDNALKYTDPGDAVWISAEPAAGDGEVILRIADEGCGIEAEHLPRLFERFYRVDLARSRAQGGTGLGLAIVKHIVQAHGGTIAVESTPGTGTTFTMRLPRRRG